MNDREQGKLLWLDLLSERGRMLRSAVAGGPSLVMQARLCGASDHEIVYALGISENLFALLFAPLDESGPQDIA
jgi:hypothetical protein